MVALRRYPVKSMMGEELNAVEVSEVGLLGDRAYAIVDVSDGKIASAKNPRKWPDLFCFRAAFIDPPQSGARFRRSASLCRMARTSPVTRADINQILSRALSRKVTFDAATLSRPGGPIANAEEYWADIEGLEHRDIVTDFALPEGTFFDTAVVHVLATATLDRLRDAYPQGCFEAHRFRPNIVVRDEIGEKAFVENAWIGKVLAIGDTVRLTVTGPCSRCVMTTLPQGDLPKDVGILRAAAQHNQANVGIYASVRQGGKVRRGAIPSAWSS